jgi:hypothetical protein
MKQLCVMRFLQSTKRSLSTPQTCYLAHMCDRASTCEGVRMMIGTPRTCACMLQSPLSSSCLASAQQPRCSSRMSAVKPAASCKQQSRDVAPSAVDLKCCPYCMQANLYLVGMREFADSAAHAVHVQQLSAIVMLASCSTAALWVACCSARSRLLAYATDPSPIATRVV